MLNMIKCGWIDSTLYNHAAHFCYKKPGNLCSIVIACLLITRITQGLYSFP